MEMECGNFTAKDSGTIIKILLFIKMTVLINSMGVEVKCFSFDYNYLTTASNRVMQ